MKSVSFISLSTLGLLLSLVATVGIHGLNDFLVPRESLALMVSFVGIIYGAYFLANSANMTGRLICFSGYLISNFLVLIIDPRPLTVIAINVFVLWLIRSFYYHQNARAAILDAGISIFSLFAAYWVLSTSHSWFLSLWSFFLIQALVTLYPREPAESSSVDPVSGQIRFNSALKQAQSAIHQLSQAERF